MTSTYGRTSRSRLSRERRYHGELISLLPALLRSQLLSLLYQAAAAVNYQEGGRRHLETARAADALLGDRVLQNVGRKAAMPADWADTFDAEYVRPTRSSRRADHARRQLAHTVKAW